jgi:ABC-2 type transport system permease protein
MNSLNAIITIAARDVTKLFRDRFRVLANLIFPVIFVGVLGTSLQANLGGELKYNFLTFVFIGVLGQTLFQSTASGLISLIEDRQTDFAQELFISPISRYAIIVGKIIGETIVALIQILGVLIFGLLFGIPLDFHALLLLSPVFVLVSFFGGTFGILVMSNLKDQKSANQIFPFLIFPQFFLSGVFNPIKVLPPILFVASRISPMTYAVDLIRSLYYLGKPEATYTVLHPPILNFAVVIAMSLIFIFIGTYLFVKNERQR